MRAAVRTQSGFLVDPSIGHSWDVERSAALRLQQIDSTCAVHGVVKALALYEDAEAVARDAAAKAQARNHHATAAGFLAAAGELRTCIRVLVERHG